MPSRAVASVPEKDVQRAANFSLHLVEFRAEDGVDLRGTGEPQPECDLAGSDEVIETGEAAGRQRPPAPGGRATRAGSSAARPPVMTLTEHRPAPPVLLGVALAAGVPLGQCHLGRTGAGPAGG